METEYTRELEVPTFGFINNGNICYFNSLLQCIINCKYIMHYIINEQKSSNELQLFFKNKFIKFTKLYNKEDMKNFNRETSTFSYELLKILLNKHKQFNINEQQSSSEFFLYLIEELGIEHFFKMRHQIYIHCGNCKNISSKIDESYHYEMFCDNYNENNSSIDIDDFMYSVNVIKDYKCDKCNTKSRSLYEKQALNICTYFVVLLNKYYNKINIDFPNTFQLLVKKEDNILTKTGIIENYIPTNSIWNNISKIEHNGHLFSGHYTAVCKRFNKIFTFDDTNIELQELNEIKPTKNTYMIFYEKY
jgi:ubiquitin C-terminal hydrolase